VLSIGTKIGDLEILNDLERRNGRYFALFRRILNLLRAHPRKILDTPMMYVNYVYYAYRYLGRLMRREELYFTAVLFDTQMTLISQTTKQRHVKSISQV